MIDLIEKIKQNRTLNMKISSKSIIWKITHLNEKKISPNWHKRVVRRFLIRIQHVLQLQKNALSPNQYSTTVYNECRDSVTNTMGCCLGFVQMIFYRLNTRPFAQFQRNLHSLPGIFFVWNAIWTQISIDGDMFTYIAINTASEEASTSSEYGTSRN